MWLIWIQHSLTCKCKQISRTICEKPTGASAAVKRSQIWRALTALTWHLQRGCHLLVGFPQKAFRLLEKAGHIRRRFSLMHNVVYWLTQLSVNSLYIALQHIKHSLYCTVCSIDQLHEPLQMIFKSVTMVAYQTDRIGERWSFFYERWMSCHSAKLKQNWEALNWEWHSQNAEKKTIDVATASLPLKMRGVFLVHLIDQTGYKIQTFSIWKWKLF